MRSSLTVSEEKGNPSSFSLDEPWGELKKFMISYCSEYERTFKECREKAFTPAMEHVGNTENELSVMIETARDCESTTAKTKCEVEFGMTICCV